MCYGLRWTSKVEDPMIMCDLSSEEEIPELDTDAHKPRREYTVENTALMAGHGSAREDYFSQTRPTNRAYFGREGLLIEIEWEPKCNWNDAVTGRGMGYEVQALHSRTGIDQLYREVKRLKVVFDVDSLDVVIVRKRSVNLRCIQGAEAERLKLRKELQALHQIDRRQT